MHVDPRQICRREISLKYPMKWPTYRDGFIRPMGTRGWLENETCESKAAELEGSTGKIGQLMDLQHAQVQRWLLGLAPTRAILVNSVIVVCPHGAAA